MQTPNRSNNQQLISEETIEKVLAQRKAESGEIDQVQGKSRMVSLQMPDDLIRRCEAMAKKKSLTRSGFIKMALSDYLSANEKK